MSKPHGIAWLNVPGRTGITWNPIVGCSPVSPGCKNCYAAAMAKREASMGQRQYQGRTTKNGAYNGTTKLVKKMLDRPLGWKRKPRFCFVCSMGDLFHDNVCDTWLGAVLATIANSRDCHRFALLTKRPERMAWIFDNYVGMGELGNKVILGTSIENQETADERLPHLLSLAAQGWKTWVSYEPALGPVDFGLFRTTPYSVANALHRHLRPSWLVIGGETGPGARECCVDDLLDVRYAAHRSGVSIFVKQLGSKPVWRARSNGPTPDGLPLQLTDRRGADPSEWPEDVQVREWPEFLTEGV